MSKHPQVEEIIEDIKARQQNILFEDRMSNLSRIGALQDQGSTPPEIVVFFSFVIFAIAICLFVFAYLSDFSSGGVVAGVVGLGLLILSILMILDLRSRAKCKRKL
jgi:hypothetical protein